MSAPAGPSLTAALRRLRALETDRASSDGAALAADLRSRLPAEELRSGPEPLIDELTAIWALESPDADAVRVVADDGRFALPLCRLDEAGLFAGGALLPSGAAFCWRYEVTRGGRRTLLPGFTLDQQAEQAQSQRGIGNRLEVYATHPDSRPRPDVPRGTLHAHPDWRSQVFAGTTRDWWLYVPALRPGDEPASALAFRGYDFTTRWGAGFHSGRHGRAIFPDTLRWLWRDWRG